MHRNKLSFSLDVNLIQSMLLPARDGIFLLEPELQEGWLRYLLSGWGRRSSTIHPPGKPTKGARGFVFGRLHSSWRAEKHGLSTVICDIICSTRSVLRAENHYMAQLLSFTKARSKSGSVLIGKLKSYLLFKPQLPAQGCQHFTGQPN